MEENKHQRTCIICGNRKIHYNFSVDNFRIEKCSNCTLMQINPQPTANEYLDLKHSAKIENSSDFDQKYFELLESYAGSILEGKILKIGPACKQFNRVVSEKNLKVNEVSIKNNYDIHHFEQDLYNQNIKIQDSEQCFDYVFLFDILHKVKNPKRFLHNIKALIKERGFIISILPSLDTHSPHIIKYKWLEFNPYHLWYFSKKTLMRLLHNESFGELKFNFIKDDDFTENPQKPFQGLPFSSVKFTNYFLNRNQNNKIILFAKNQPAHNLKKLSIIMPAYNEAQYIKNVIDKILAKTIEGIEIELIIIESNSNDGTRKIVAQYEKHDNVIILWQDVPKGKGNAVRAGLEKVSGDFILIQDADTEYDIEDYDALVEPLISGEATFVLGARHGGGAWKMRQFEDQKLIGHILNLGHWIFTMLVNIFYGLKLKDPFTMYKVFRADCLRGIKLECNRFDFDYELLIKLVKKGHYPIEIPVNYRSRSFKEGKKVNALRDPWTWLFAIIKYKFQQT